MELREWLIILGLALVTIIVIDGVRRLQRQRRVPRLDQVDNDATGSGKGEVADPEQAAREAEVNWELPNGGARVVKPASYSSTAESKPKPKLQRQEHPGPSKVLANWRNHQERTSTVKPERPRSEAETKPANPSHATSEARQASRSESPAAASAASNTATAPREDDVRREASVAANERPAASSDASSEQHETRPKRNEPTLSALDDEPERDSEVAGLAADPEDHDEAERYRLVDLEGMGDSLKSGSARMGASVQRFGASLQKNFAERKAQRKKDKLKREQEKVERQAREASRRQQAKAEREAREAEKRQREKERSLVEDDYDDPLFAPPRAAAPDEAAAMERETADSGDASLDYQPQPVVTPHPVVEKALRNDVSAQHARDTLSHAEEVIVISVMSRDEEGFSGAALLDLMLACGLRYSSEMGIFHRFETEDPESELQFSMVNVVKPGIFPLEAMDEFTTPGITLLMPLPGATDTAAAFEAMVETAMVVVRHLGGELKDENHSVMTAQTVEFARQRVQEFERRHRLHRYQAN
ncbi:cell division protein ZipA [Litchfieldella rifensis]|uniref:Cell division protein ZipA n=1 Tax=Litchfieldella rifensis TaxID=762643 RepID=A0ABV7LQJ5_9GAMM